MSIIAIVEKIKRQTAKFCVFVAAECKLRIAYIILCTVDKKIIEKRFIIVIVCAS